MSENINLQNTHFRVKQGKDIYELFAIVCKKFYLIEVSKGELGWCKAKSFVVENKPLPKFWSYIKLDDDMKQSRYWEAVFEKEFWGPKEFINMDFMLNIDYKDNAAAYKYSCEVMKKYNSLVNNSIEDIDKIKFIDSKEWTNKYLK